MLKEIETLSPNFSYMIYGNGRSERSVEREKASFLYKAFFSLFFLFLLVHGFMLRVLSLLLHRIEQQSMIDVNSYIFSLTAYLLDCVNIAISGLWRA